MHARLVAKPRASPALCCADELGEPLTQCGGLRKVVHQAAAEDAAAPKWGAQVRIFFTGHFGNGTAFDRSHSKTPFDFQLNTDAVVDGMEIGVKSMRPGERATLRCEPRWAYGEAGIGSRIPPNATLFYDVELISWEEGSRLAENTDLDMETYKQHLAGKAVTEGRTDAYRWSEGGEEVTLWLPLQLSESTRHISCDIRTRKLFVSVDAGDGEARAVSGTLRGRAEPDASYWVIDDENGGRELQIVLVKANSFTKWDGVLVEEE